MLVLFLPSVSGVDVGNPRERKGLYTREAGTLLVMMPGLCVRDGGLGVFSFSLFLIAAQYRTVGKMHCSGVSTVSGVVY